MRQQICTVCHQVGKPKYRLSGKKKCAACDEGPLVPVDSPRGQELLRTSRQAHPAGEAEGAEANSDKRLRLTGGAAFLLALLAGPVFGAMGPDLRNASLAVLILLSALAVIIHPKLMLMPNRRASAGLLFGLFLVFSYFNGAEVTEHAKAREGASRPSAVSRGKVIEFDVSDGKGNAPASTNPVPVKNSSGLSDQRKQALWIEETKDGVRRRLKDAGSAEFRNVFFNEYEDGPIVCGEVNSKNGFGGYTGFQHFVGSGTKLVFLEEEVDGFSEVWNEMCAKK